MCLCLCIRRDVYMYIYIFIIYMLYMCMFVWCVCLFAAISVSLFRSSWCACLCGCRGGCGQSSLQSMNARALTKSCNGNQPVMLSWHLGRRLRLRSLLPQMRCSLRAGGCCHGSRKGQARPSVHYDNDNNNSNH